MNRSVISAFDKASSTYNTAGEFQQFSAHRLALSLPDLAVNRPRILEIGAGTGFVTSFLLKRYSDCILTVTDASQGMIEQCQTNILQEHPDKQDDLSFSCVDMDSLLNSELGNFDLIVCGMTLQWINNPIDVLKKLKSFVHRGGFVVFSTLSDNTFCEWRRILSKFEYDLKVAHISRRDLSVLSDWGGKLEFYTVHDDYGSGTGFISHLKKTGAYTNLSTPIPASILRKAIGSFDGKITYDLVIGTISKADIS